MGNTRQKHEQDTAIKLRFYFMSLWLLFVLIFLLTVDIPICFSKDAHYQKTVYPKDQLLNGFPSINMSG